MSPVFQHSFPGYEVEPGRGLQHLLQHGAMSARRFERAETPKPMSRCQPTSHRSAVCEMWVNSASERFRTWIQHTLRAPRNSVRGDALYLLRTDHLLEDGQCERRARAQFTRSMDEPRHRSGAALFTRRGEPAGTRLEAGPVAKVHKTRTAI